MAERRHLIGKRGPELILPLMRGPDGRLIGKASMAESRLLIGDALVLSGFVGDNFLDDGFTSREVLEALAEHGRGDLTVRLNSGGGVVFEGAAVHAALKAHPGAVTMMVEGVAASAASLIAMAGDEIIMAEGAMMMIHDPRAATFGTAAAHRRSADTLDKLAETYVGIYARRSGRDDDDVRELMRAETWFTAEEAVEAGFADRVAENAPARVVAAFPYEIFAHAPQRLVALAVANGWRAAGHLEAGQKGNEMTSKTKAAEAAPTKTAEQTTDPALAADATAKAVKAERDRASGIRQAVAAARLDPAMADTLIDEGVSLDKARERIISMWAEQGDNHEHPPRATVGRSWDHGEGFRAKMVDALTARIDPDHEPTKGRELVRMTLGQIAMAAARERGLRPWNEAEAITMATHTTSDFPLILENSMTNLVARRIEQATPATTRVSRAIDRVDYSAGKSLTLSASGTPAEIGEGGEINFVTMDERGEPLPVPRDFGAGFNVSNKALQNDRLDLLNNAAQRMTQGAIERFRSVLLEPIIANAGAGQTLADGKTMFHADHGNLASSGAAISVTTLGAARRAMRLQTGLQGELLAIAPAFIYVPAALETVAQQVVAQITAAKFADVNPFSGELEVVVEPGLDATSATAWYLVGDPAAFDGHQHAFLDGRRSPRVQSREAWSTLGMEFRLTWHLDAKFVEHASWFKNPGA